jgi:hypothetical protein
MNQSFKEQDGKLNEHTLASWAWTFYNDDGVLGEMTFGPEGKITTYQHTNEAYWELDSDSILTISDIDYSPTCRFIKFFRDFDGRWHLEGRFIPLDNGWKHYLVQKHPV